MTVASNGKTIQPLTKYTLEKRCPGKINIICSSLTESSEVNLCTFGFKSSYFRFLDLEFQEKGFDFSICYRIRPIQVFSSKQPVYFVIT